MAESGQRYELVVSTAGERIDRYVADALDALSRTAVQRLIDEGVVTVNGEPVQASDRVELDDVIIVTVPPSRDASLEPEAIPLDILYEDETIIVINKAAGMVVHPGAGQPSGTLVNAILAHCPDLAGVGGEIRPGIVHRLDRDTSGVIIVAKHDRALRALQRQFKRRSVEKHYLALVVGQVPHSEGLIEAPIGRDRQNRRRMAVRGDGKMARTRWKVAGSYRDSLGQRYTLVDVRLLTGRTHQIRVHFTWMGHPIAGDATYGGPAVSALAPRQFLHAKSLTVTHPITEERMTFVAPLARDLVDRLASLTLVED
jgi:23S rRNA pseudouridine1911/1915/1917 synthase